jgi:hypothetical protein
VLQRAAVKSDDILHEKLMPAAGCRLTASVASAVPCASPARRPGAKASAGEENGALAIAFEPDTAGFLIVALMFAVLGAFMVLCGRNTVPGR